MAYGLTPEGFIPKTLPIIKEELENELRSSFGEDIDLSPQTVFGQTVGIFSQKHADIWALAFDIYTNAYPDSASGIHLDRVCSLTGIIRNTATPSRATAIAYGISGTSIPAGQEVRDSKTNNTYTSTEAVTITTNTARDATVVILAPVVGSYVVTINGTPYTYTASGTPTINTIVNGLVAVITGAGAVASNVNNKLRLLNASIPFSVAVTPNMRVDDVGVAMEVVNTVAGAADVPLGAIDTIDTPVSGWLRVTNLVQGFSGTNRETDEDLRLRRELSLEKSIIKEVLEVAGVTQGRVFENNTDITDADGTPAHHIWVIVEGGTATDIATAIIEHNAAGIGTRGAQQGTSLSPVTGLSTIARFDRPTYVYPAIVITYSLTEEGTFPVDGVQQAKNALVAYGKTLKIGDDLIYSRLFAPIHSVRGLQINTLTVNAGTASLSIDKDELVVIRNADITMTVTP
jgi:uncharacterized phage protein gp47/JayE